MRATLLLFFAPLLFLLIWSIFPAPPRLGPAPPTYRVKYYLWINVRNPRRPFFPLVPFFVTDPSATGQDPLPHIRHHADPRRATAGRVHGREGPGLGPQDRHVRGPGPRQLHVGPHHRRRHHLPEVGEGEATGRILAPQPAWGREAGALRRGDEGRGQEEPGVRYGGGGGDGGRLERAL